MSAWRVALRELYDAGGTARSNTFGCRSGKRRLLEYGLATCSAATNNTTYTLTPLGIEFLLNKSIFIQQRPGGYIKKNTWIAPLPSKDDMDNSALEYMVGYSDALRHMRETIPARPTAAMIKKGADTLDILIRSSDNTVRTDMIADAVWETMYNFCLSNSVLKKHDTTASKFD